MDSFTSGSQRSGDSQYSGEGGSGLLSVESFALRALPFSLHDHLRHGLAGFSKFPSIELMTAAVPEFHLLLLRSARI